MKIVVLYSRLSGYILSSIDYLHSMPGVEVPLIIAHAQGKETNYRFSEYVASDRIVDKIGLSRSDILRLVSDFSPDLIYTVGWVDRDYLWVCRKLKRTGVDVIVNCDTQYRGDLRQLIGRFVFRLYLRHSVSGIYVGGERQRLLANYYGYSGRRVRESCFTCDNTLFSQESRLLREKAFVFVGRLSTVKGIDILIAEYKRYRNNCENPWDLWICGLGELQSLLNDVDGVVLHGFCQPNKLKEILDRASCFVLPSRYEPWGLVIHEAACAGLPIICSHACGSSISLVRNGYNGYQFDHNCSGQLAEVMECVTLSESSKLSDMGKASFSLSKQYSIAQWANNLIEFSKTLKTLNSK